MKENKMIQQVVISITQQDVDMMQRLVDEEIEFDWSYQSENSDDLIEIYFTVGDGERDEQ